MVKFAIIRKKECWTATWLGNLLKLILVLILCLWYLFSIHGFLSVSKPVNSNILVVEGFIPDYAIEQAGIIFGRDHYDMMIITGNKRVKGAHLDIYENDGEYTAATLEKLGFDRSKITVVPVNREVNRDRTYTCARTLKLWMEDHSTGGKDFNLVTLGCHARRSRLLFQKAFGNDVKVGIIAVKDEAYDASGWWKSSHGFRDVIKETIAWVYARFFFYP